MGKKVEKSFEERLHSLKVGCVIFGVLEVLALISNVYSLMEQSDSASLLNIIIPILMLADIYYMYKYTSEKNPKGPTCEKIFGILLLIEGIIYCLTVVGIVIGIICIVLALGILDEAKYLKEYINNNTNDDVNDDENTNL